MVDCPTEDVPFREGAFGGAGDGTNAPGFPFLAVFGLPQALTSFAFSESKTGNPSCEA